MTNFDQQPRIIKGDSVRIVEGEYAGRTGRVEHRVSDQEQDGAGILAVALTLTNHRALVNEAHLVPVRSDV